MEQVILVDELDNEIGTKEKMQAHREALLHRAFSVFIFNKKGELLLQRRALNKYHSPGLWTNTCCSHPRPNEQLINAAKRRLIEEMGFVCDLNYQFNFIYKASLDQGMTEHELDHVFFGTYEDEIKLNPEEVAEYKFISMEELQNSINKQPQLFTEWFKIVFEKVKKAHHEYYY
jgi:isopentenyl-diphosphate delta-isomerase